MITLPESPVLSRGGNTARTFFIAIGGMAVRYHSYMVNVSEEERNLICNVVKCKRQNSKN